MQVLGTDGRSPHKILLVDDNRMGLLARKTVLTENGYDVTTVDKPEQVLELMNGAKFELVVTDYKMPKMNGIELISQLRAAGHRQPIILMSGYVEALGLTEASTGSDSVIQKSANEIPRLLHAVKSLLQSRRKPPAGYKPRAAERRSKA